MHENCTISFLNSESASLLKGILESSTFNASSSSRSTSKPVSDSSDTSSSSSSSPDAILDKLAASLLEQTPAKFDYEAVEQK
jgi:hypothetical protein